MLYAQRCSSGVSAASEHTVHTSVQYRLPALTISVASEHTVCISIQSCGFMRISGSIRVIVEHAALNVKGHMWGAALKVKGAKIQ